MTIKSILAPVIVALTVGCGRTPETPSSTPVDAYTAILAHQVETQKHCIDALKICLDPKAETTHKEDFDALCEEFNESCGTAPQKKLFETDPDAARAEFAVFERAARDTLFKKLHSEEYLLQLRRLLPTYTYDNRRAFAATRIEKEITVGPEYYLFDQRHVKPDWSDEGPTDSYSARYDLFDAMRDYQDSVTRKQTSLGLPVETSSDYAPFYASVRSPSDEDLRQLYSFVPKMPSFLWKAFLEHTDTGYAAAAKLIRENPPLYQAKYENYDVPDTARPATSYRLTNGELVIDKEYDYDLVFFSPAVEASTSPYAKFLFRRGEPFTTNARIIFHCLRDAKDEKDFVAKVRQHIPAQ